MTRPKSLVTLIKEYLKGEGHAFPYSKCKCYFKELHLALEKEENAKR